MSRRRKAFTAIAAMGVIVLALVALWVARLFTGPGLPAGAERLHIVTAAPNLTTGCAAALLSPVRVSTEGEELILVSVESGETMRVVWPAGFGAWRIDGRAVVADFWGSVVGREGDVLDTLGGGEGLDGAFEICPYGIMTERRDHEPVGEESRDGPGPGWRLGTQPGRWSLDRPRQLQDVGQGDGG